MIPIPRQLGDLTDDLAQAAAEMTDLNNTLTAAVAAGQTDALPALKQQLAYWRARWQTLSAQQSSTETPSSAALALSNVGDSLSGLLSGTIGKLTAFVGVGLVVWLAGPALIRAARGRSRGA